MKWSEVKKNVAGCCDCDVAPEAIVDAIHLSKSPEHFVELIRGALSLTDAVHAIVFGENGGES